MQRRPRNGRRSRQKCPVPPIQNVVPMKRPARESGNDLFKQAQRIRLTVESSQDGGGQTSSIKSSITLPGVSPCFGMSGDDGPAAGIAQTRQCLRPCQVKKREPRMFSGLLWKTKTIKLLTALGLFAADQHQRGQPQTTQRHRRRFRNHLKDLYTSHPICTCK